MRIFVGLLCASFVNFLMGLFGYYLSMNTFIYNYAPQASNDPTFVTYFWSFLLKFLVITILTWIMYRVMTMLDTPKKRVLFIFLTGSSLSLYNEVNLFWSGESAVWSIILILGESINWLLTGFVLSRFMKPKHLGAL